jgi:putative transposase
MGGRHDRDPHRPTSTAGRLLSAVTGLHPDAELACAAIKMAVATRGGKDAIWRDDEAERVIFHTDRGSTYTANAFTRLWRQLGIRQSTGRRA